MTMSATLAHRFKTTPWLEPGDRLTRAEFERRYEAMPKVEKAELIEGVVYMPSPVRLEYHGIPHAEMMCWLGHYKAFTPGLRVADNTSVRLDIENEPQPDGLLMIDPAWGGQARISDDDYIEGAPEFVAEIAASSASIDLDAKLRVYQRNQVQEYLVWRVIEDAVDWFVLRDTQYQRLQVDDAGRYRSQVLPGLWLDAAALIRKDTSSVLKVLQEGIASPEHAEFVRRLQSQKN